MMNMLEAKSSPPVTLPHVPSDGCWRINNTQFPGSPSSHLNLHPNKNKLISSAKVILRRGKVVVCMSNVESGGGAAVPSGSPGSSGWRQWLAGVIMSVLLPFWRNQLWSLKKIQASIESVVETVEEVAEKVEEVVEEMEEKLPEGEFKEVLEKVEKVAEKAAKAADVGQQVLNKVQAMEDDVESYIDVAAANKNQKMG